MRILLALTFFLISSLSIASGYEDKLTSPMTKLIVASPVVCPYVCGSEEKHPGYIEDLFHEIAKEENFEIEFIHTSKDYAEYLFKNSMVDVILFADELFHGEMKSNKKIELGKIEIGKIKPALFSHGGKGIGIKNLTMSKENWPLVFGSRKVVLAPFEGFNHWVTGISHQLGSVESEFNFKKALTELQYGVKDLILHDANVFHYQLSKLPFDYGVSEVGTIVSNKTESSIYALTNESLTKGDSIAAKISRGLIHMRRGGKLRTVLSKYKVKDWNGFPVFKEKPMLAH